MPRSKRLYRATLCMCLLSSLLWTEGPASSATVSPLQGPVPKRLLIVVPHPDDESLGSLSLIQRTLRTGGSVHVVLMTNGDGFRLAAAKMTGVSAPGPKEFYRLGLIRQQEELQAAHHLGLRTEDVEFLGYPDGGLNQLWSTKHWDKQKPYHALNGYSQVPYPLSFHKGGAYAGQSVVEDLQRLFDTFQPTDVLYPDPEDIHHDHAAASAFTQYLLAGQKEQPNAWTYLVHYPDFPQPRHYTPGAPLLPPAPLQIGRQWLTLPLTAEQEQQKYAAVSSHRSQNKVMGHFLEAFVRKNELIAAPHVPIVPDATSVHGHSQPPVTLLDPLHDQLGDTHAPAADIRKLLISRQKNAKQTELQIALEMAGPLQHEDEYMLTLRQPGTPPARLHEVVVRVRQGQITLHQTPSVSPKSKSDQKGSLAFRMEKNRLLLRIPLHSFTSTTDFLIHAEVIRDKKTIDQTAWQRLHWTEQLQQKDQTHP